MIYYIQHIIGLNLGDSALLIAMIAAYILMKPIIQKIMCFYMIATLIFLYIEGFDQMIFRIGGMALILWAMMIDISARLDAKGETTTAL